MKVYFTASSFHQQAFAPIYKRIVGFLEKNGHEISGTILSQELTEPEDVSAHAIEEWYKRWNAHLRECDLAIVEGSYPSTIHVGFEISLIAATGKPLILLFKEGKDPVYITNGYANRLIKSEYAEETLEDTLTWCLDEAEKIANKRFTFFISPEIEAFLNNVVKKSNHSRSEYIRKLIEDEIKKINSM